MRYILFLFFAFILFSCSETSKVGCQSDSDCSGERICDKSANTCVTCSPDICVYENAQGECKKFDDGKLRCAMVKCNEGYYDLDKDIENGCEYACEITNNGEEVCDSTDNNCDGQIDENLDCSCNDDETNGCVVLNTSCRGVQTCISGHWGQCKAEDDTVGEEVCDGIDNDCNDGVDEDFKIDGVYSLKEHCGGCDKKCDDVNSISNNCEQGVCKPVCKAGWNDFDENGYNGCETGCNAHSFGSSLTKEVVSDNIDAMDSFYSNGKIFLVYRKPGSDRNTINAKILNDDGEVIKDEILVSGNQEDKYYGYPKIVLKGSKVFMLYRGKVTTDLVMTIKSDDLSIGDTYNAVDGGFLNKYYGYDITESKFDDSVYIIWSQGKDELLGTGNDRKIYFRKYEDGELKDIVALSGEDGKKRISPKIATVKSGFNGNYLAIAYCEEISEGVSNLHYYVHLADGSNNYDILVKNFNNEDCSDFENTGSIVSGDNGFYVSYLKNNIIHIEHVAYIKLRGEISILDEYLIGGDENLEYKGSSLYFKNDNLVLGYTAKEIVEGGQIDLINSKKGYMRFTSDLKFKNGKDFITAIGYYLITDNDVVFYENDKVILVFKKVNTNSAKNIRLAETESCEN